MSATALALAVGVGEGLATCSTPSFIRMTVIQSSTHEVVMQFSPLHCSTPYCCVIIATSPMTSAEVVDDAGKRARGGLNIRRSDKKKSYIVRISASLTEFFSKAYLFLLLVHPTNMAFIRDIVNFAKFEAQNWWSSLTWTEDSIPNLRCALQESLCHIVAEHSCINSSSLWVSEALAILKQRPVCVVLCRGKTILVTGATDGTGFHCARAFAQHGARVIIHGRNEEKARG